MSDIGRIETVRPASFVDWPAIIGGGAIATGVSSTLLAFGSGIGLAVASASPTWRESSPWLWLLSGVFLILVALAAFGFGGYAAGRMRAPSALRTERETHFRDGMHGLFTWGLAIFITALLALAGAAIGASGAAPQGGAGPAASVASETALATELDELFRDARMPAADLELRRAEAGRILLKASSHDGVSVDDRAYLASMVAAQSRIRPEDAAARVDRVVAESKEALHRARVAAVLQAFMVAAALLIGAAVAWFSAIEGGKDRERGVIPVWRWSWRERA